MAKTKSDQKKYRNEGVTELIIEGVVIRPGDEFTATLEPHFEEQMLVGGHLSLLADQGAAADRAQADAADGTVGKSKARNR